MKEKEKTSERTKIISSLTEKQSICDDHTEKYYQTLLFLISTVYIYIY